MQTSRVMAFASTGFLFLFIQIVGNGAESMVESVAELNHQLLSEADSQSINSGLQQCPGIGTGKSLDKDCNDLESAGEKKSRKKRQSVAQKRFIGTFDPKDFPDLDTTNSEFKWLNTQVPDGFYPHNKFVLLEFDPSRPDYPPFTYRGFHSPKLWHKIDIRTLMRKRNRSFMLLADYCDRKTKEKIPNATLHDFRRCEESIYPAVFPVCNSPTQSPININSSRVVNWTHPNYDFEISKKGIEFMISLPWDGTGLLTVELLGAVRDPALSLEVIAEDVADETRTPEFAQTPKISRGNLRGPDLFLDRIHIKYGTNPNEGSEHRIDKSFGMELQFIFTQFGRSTSRKYWDRLQRDYEDLFESQRTVDLGKYVHILSVLVEVQEVADFEKTNKDNEWNRKASKAFEAISLAAKEFWAVSNRRQTWGKFRAFKSNPAYLRVNDSDESHLLRLDHILPPQIRTKTGGFIHSTYLAYLGGLTHPPCFDNIEWSIYEEPLRISVPMWKRFLYIPSEFDDSGFLAGNFRNVGDIYVKDLDYKLEENTREAVNAAKRKFENRPVHRSRAEGSVFEKDYYEDYGVGVNIQNSIAITMFCLCLTFCVKISA